MYYYICGFIFIDVRNDNYHILPAGRSWGGGSAREILYGDNIIAVCWPLLLLDSILSIPTKYFFI